MPELDELLEFSKSIATQAGERILNSTAIEHKNYVHSIEHPKEIKAHADTVLETDILEALISTGISILSEESGYIHGDQEKKYWFIVDPLDGTFNFVKGLGPSAVSIALWRDKIPVFGVIYNLSEQKLYWGGNGLGAYQDGLLISVSDVLKKEEASICTGFPVRFDPADETSKDNFWRLVRPFAKVRMLGSAAISLLNVAKGAADVYSEQNIMLWDVAAGLAIVEGAGGVYAIQKNNVDYSYHVDASNSHIPISSPGYSEV